MREIMGGCGGRMYQGSHGVSCRVSHAKGYRIDQREIIRHGRIYRRSSRRMYGSYAGSKY